MNQRNPDEWRKLMAYAVSTGIVCIMLAIAVLLSPEMLR